MQVIIEDTVCLPDRYLQAGDKFKATTSGRERVAVYVAIRTAPDKLILIDLSFCNRNHDGENFDKTSVKDVIKERKERNGEHLVYFEANTCTFS